MEQGAFIAPRSTHTPLSTHTKASPSAGGPSKDPSAGLCVRRRLHPWVCGTPAWVLTCRQWPWCSRVPVGQWQPSWHPPGKQAMRPARWAQL